MNVIDGTFLSLIGQRGLTEVRGDSWVTDVTSLDVEVGERIAGAAYDAANRDEALIEVDGALAHLILHRESLTARIAGRDAATVERVRLRLREALHEIDPDTRGEAPFTFWWATEHGPGSMVRTLPVPSLTETANNYQDAVREQLDSLASIRDPSGKGQLILWHGPPGAGKTYAVRSLAWEWRRWCDFHYVTDPDALFATDSAGYLMAMVTRRAAQRHGLSGDQRWRCLVLEDTGELMAADAKHRTGQALSRLLNVVDGLLGQGFNVLVLVTTNEPLSKLHPAATRHGRCLAEIEFGPLPVAAANEWLAGKGSQARVSAPACVAELYAALDGQTASDAPAFGFAA